MHRPRCRHFRKRVTCFPRANIARSDPRPSRLAHQDREAIAASLSQQRLRFLKFQMSCASLSSRISIYQPRFLVHPKSDRDSDFRYRAGLNRQGRNAASAASSRSFSPVLGPSRQLSPILYGRRRSGLQRQHRRCGWRVQRWDHVARKQRLPKHALVSLMPSVAQNLYLQHW